MAHTLSLKSLTPSEAVADALHRAILGLDTNDSTLFESAWDKDEACFDRDGTVLDGWDAISEHLYQTVSKLESHHTIGNIRVDLKDDETAHMTAYTIARHDRVGEATDPTKKGLVGGSIYSIDLVKDKGSPSGPDRGLWKMRKWAMKICWVEGNVSVVQ